MLLVAIVIQLVAFAHAGDVIEGMITFEKNFFHSETCHEDVCHPFLIDFSTDVLDHLQ
jgi:hypothetical protein